MKSADARRPGFTLLEVVVALTIASIVVLGAHAMVDALGRHADRSAMVARSGDRSRNAERLIRSLAARVEIGVESSRRFTGSERSTRFATWCDAPAGWQERCTATIAFDTTNDVLAITLSTGERIELRHGFRQGALLYLGSAENGGTWMQSWGDGITAPLAIGIVIDADTQIVRMGQRG